MQTQSLTQTQYQIFILKHIQTLTLPKPSPKSERGPWLGKSSSCFHPPNSIVSTCSSITFKQHFLVKSMWGLCCLSFCYKQPAYSTCEWVNKTGLKVLEVLECTTWDKKFGGRNRGHCSTYKSRLEDRFKGIHQNNKVNHPPPTPTFGLKIGRIFKMDSREYFPKSKP